MTPRASSCACSRRTSSNTRSTSTPTCARPLPRCASRRSKADDLHSLRCHAREGGHPITRVGRSRPRPCLLSSRAITGSSAFADDDSQGAVAASALSGAQPIETLLLLVAERRVELRERGLNGLHRAQHRIEPLLHRLQTAHRRERAISRAIRAQLIDRLGSGVLQLLEGAALRLV